MSKSVTPESAGGRPVTEADPTTADGFDAERAAIIEYDGGIARAYAEAFARMQHNRPDDVTEERWRQVIDDAGRFLDRWGEAVAAFGWTVADLFGRAERGAHGLLWELDGRAVVAVREEGAMMGEGARMLSAWFSRPTHR